MSILDRFLFLIGLRPEPGPRTYQISESMHTTLVTLASHEGRPEYELLPDLLAAGLTQYQNVDELWSKWLTLTAREQHVAALACLEYTNREIGGRLNISHETVKVRLKAALRTFGVHTRAELRMLLARWDFSAYERAKYD